jgi:hypothetical protein
MPLDQPHSYIHHRPCCQEHDGAGCRVAHGVLHPIDKAVSKRSQTVRGIERASHAWDDVETNRNQEKLCSQFHQDTRLSSALTPESCGNH